MEGIPHHFGPIAEASGKQDHHTYFQKESRDEVTQGRFLMSYRSAWAFDLNSHFCLLMPSLA